MKGGRDMKTILVALEDSIHSDKCLNYVSQILKGIENTAVTLFHVQPILSDYLVQAAKSSAVAKAKLSQTTSLQETESTRFLNNKKERLVRYGIAADRIETVTQARQLGITKDILNYAENRKVGAIVVGRRGLSRIQETFMGSVSAKLLEHTRNIPIWVVDEAVYSNRLLIAMDGSKGARKAFDFAVNFAVNNLDITLTLLYVDQRASNIKRYFPVPIDKDIIDMIEAADREAVDAIHNHAYRKAKNAGITKNRIDVITRPTNGKIGKEIIREAESGPYGTVVLGRSGIDTAFFFGSVSRYVAERISGRTLWLVP
jgi:nucleotide-binding universal stress UspA family protein